MRAAHRALPNVIVARSASDRSDDWPYWYVAETGQSLNITGPIARALGYDWPAGAVLTDRASAEHLAEEWCEREARP